MSKNILSRVVGAIGAVLVLTSAVTLFFGNARFLAGKLLLGLACIAISFAFGEAGGLRRFFAGRALHFGAVTAVSVAALVAVLAAANYLATKRPRSWDLTKNRIYTLQPDTLRTLDGLEQDVRAVAVYRMDEEGWAQAEALLRRYAARSPRFHYELVDPYKSPEKARALGVLAGGPRILLIAGEQKAPASAADEQGVTNALVKVTRRGSRKVYFSAGHGEAEPASAEPRGYGKIAQALQSEGWEVAPLALSPAGEVPADASVVVVAGARKALLPGEVKALERYAAQGGHLGLFLEPEVDLGLDPLLAGFGIQADDDVVVDPSPAAQILGSPVTPIALPSGAHPITRELTDTALVLPTSRSLVALTGQPVQPTPLALTGAEAWGETDVKGVFERGEARRSDGEKAGALPLAMAAEKAAAGEGKRSEQARLVAAGDGDFFSNQYLQLGGNRDFFMNAVSWLGNQEDRITIRPRSREATIVLITEAQATALKFLAVDVLPVALLALGLSVWMVRRSR
jgi:ABC-type uncharacterized transport system involved in gliding motility auxiliary subunit